MKKRRDDKTQRRQHTDITVHRDDKTQRGLNTEMTKHRDV